MFSKFLADIKFRIDYYNDLCNYIAKHTADNRPLVAVHGFCTDGGVSGAIIRHQMPEAVIVPLDYEILNHPSSSDILANLNWYGIVDLKPFNNKRVNFWVDHHLSAADQIIKADRIRFDIDGDSGAYQLFLSNFLGNLPHRLVELAVMTRTTDTANYIIEPPIETYQNLSDLKITETEGLEGRKQNEKRIWLLDDAWGSITTLKEQLEMYDALAKYGFVGLQKFLPRINKMREKRTMAHETAKNMELSDVMLYSFAADTLDHFTITRRLQKLGAKVVISLALVPDGVKISMRRNRELRKTENDLIQLNELAQKMNGGGHAGASGAKTSSLIEAIEIISDWAKKLNMKLSYKKF